MSLRLFMDQCVPRSVAEALRNAGHVVDLLRDHLPINAKDPDVIAAAQSLQAVLVTLNGDFADIINFPPEKFGGIIALQVKTTRNHSPRSSCACSRIWESIPILSTMPGSYFWSKHIAFESKNRTNSVPNG